MTMTNRYQKTIKGNLVQIGNTLGLSKATNALTPGTLGSIGAFITTDSTKQATGWPNNTTLNYLENSSTAELAIPIGAVVDHAELIWSASNVVPGGNVTANINDAINFIDPLGNTNSVTANGVNFTNIALSENSESSTNYVKSADVTNIVAAAGNGIYTVGKVPCTMSATCNSLQYAGWSLYVVYKLNTDPVRNIIIFVGNEVSIDAPYSVPINYPGPPFPIRLCYSVGEGDATITGDQFNTRPTTGVVITNLGTTAQPTTNPFCSQITDQTGALDTSGVFGTLNANPSAGTNISGGRQGWDIGNNVNLISAFTGGAVANLGLDIGTNSDPAIMTSNGFIVDLNQPVANLTKSVNKSVARGGDTLQYTLVYRFTSTPVTAANIIIMDTIPSGVTYQGGSVIVNGTPQPTFDIRPPGINVGGVNGPGAFTVTFNVVVDNVVDTVTIPNSAYGYYDFNSGGAAFTNDNISNEVITTIDPFNASILKSVDKSFGDIGDVLNYTITIPNDGTTLTSVKFTDTIPTNTVFVPNSVVVNNIPQIGATPNPPAGITIQDLTPGSFTTITFSVIVTTVPSNSTVKNSGTLNTNYTFQSTLPDGASQSLNTNIVTTTISSAVILTSKFVNKQFANIGDILTYTIPILNSGNTTAINVIFQDTIPNDTTLVPGSFMQNGGSVSGSPNPPGVVLNNIPANSILTVVFKVQVNSIPNPNPIPNTATAVYSYTIDSSTTPNRVGARSSNTNFVNTQVNNASLSGISKSVDKAFATCGDTVGYTIVIPNSGNTTAFNVFVKDTLPSGATFITNSVSINGTPQPGYNPAVGITIPNIGPESIATINFSVQVQC